MKKSIKYICLAIVLVCTAAFVYPTKVPAANATKVKFKRYHTKKDYKEYAIITGYTKKGKKCWTYKTPKFTATELDCTGYKKCGNKVYVFQGSYVRVLKLSTGKSIWKKKSGIPAGYKYTFDSKDNLYLTGYYMDDICKINKNGKKLWKRNIKYTKNFWPRKLSYSKGIIKVYYVRNEKCTKDCEEYNHKHYVRINANSGKVISYQ